MLMSQISCRKGLCAALERDRRSGLGGPQRWLGSPAGCRGLGPGLYRGHVDAPHGWNFGQGQLNGDLSPGPSSRLQGQGSPVAGRHHRRGQAGRGNSGLTYDALRMALLMALRLGDTNDAAPWLHPGDLAPAIRYGTDNGAQVINLSLGWAQRGVRVDYQILQRFNLLIRRVNDNDCNRSNSPLGPRWREKPDYFG